MDLNRINNFFLSEKMENFFKREKKRGKQEATGFKHPKEREKEMVSEELLSEPGPHNHRSPALPESGFGGAETHLWVPGRSALRRPIPYDFTWSKAGDERGKGHGRKVWKLGCWLKTHTSNTENYAAEPMCALEQCESRSPGKRVTEPERKEVLRC